MLFEVRVILGNRRNIYPGRVLNTGELKYVLEMRYTTESVPGLCGAFSRYSRFCCLVIFLDAVTKSLRRAS